MQSNDTNKNLVNSNNIANIDCMTYLQGIPDGSIDLIVTDPPYKVISGGKNDGKDKRPSGILTKNDGKIFTHNDIEIKDYLPEFYRVLKDNTDCYVMTNNINLRELLNVAHDVGFRFHNLLIWKKNNVTPNRWYMKNCEYTVYLYKGAAKAINNPSSKQMLEIDNVKGREHPTQKPVYLMEEYILNSSNEGDIVLDPFLGSGSTAIAAIRNDRIAYGCEIDNEYYDIAQRRIVEEYDMKSFIT